MSVTNQADWHCPSPEYRVNAIVHEWGAYPEVLMDAVKAFGYGGVVTNPSHENMYEDYRKNITALARVLEGLKQRGLGYWLYDESGYPSGYAGGETMKGHPELEAKGFYMRRFVAYEDRRVCFRLDCESDKIIWAAKYPMDISSLHQSYVQYDEMTALPFTKDACDCEIKAGEAMFVFCVKSAYEGSQCTHNTCSFSRYINIMDEKAVRRFLDLMYEPVAELLPDAFRDCKAVFTDEPSLMVGYSRDYEVWPYALAPWVDGLFEQYEKRYGCSILPYLPLLFEGGDKGTQVRLNFYRLVGEIIADAYSGQINRWCKAHGSRISGHYMCEESVYAHVLYYGSYIEVLKHTGYPGLDVLDCVPERFNYNTVKFPQMAARKMGSDGLMVEICPFGWINEFKLDPVNNMTAIMGPLYMSGVRATNSYFYPDFNSFDPRIDQHEGYMSREEAVRFNDYVGRMGVMLKDKKPATDVFVYYGYEDVCSKFEPQYTGTAGRAFSYDNSARRITTRILESGHDFLYADSADILSALEDGTIYGNKVHFVIVPEIDAMDAEAFKALATLARKGMKVFFLNRVPHIFTDGQASAEGINPVDEEQILDALDAAQSGFRIPRDGKLLQVRYESESSSVLMLSSMTRGETTVVCPADITLYDPESGKITPYKKGSELCLSPLRTVFAEEVRD